MIEVEASTYYKIRTRNGDRIKEALVDKEHVQNFLAAKPFFDNLAKKPERQLIDDAGNIVVKQWDPLGNIFITRFEPVQ